MAEVPDWFSKHGEKYSNVPKQWSDYYANAMRINRFFKCERCNRCCSVPAEVQAEDIVRLAHHLNKSVDAFMVEFVTENDNGSRFLNCPCPFLTERGCKIYQVRPLSCALYPFAVTHDPHLPTRQIAVLDITRDCMLGNRISSALIDLCGGELLTDSSCNTPEAIEEANKRVDETLDTFAEPLRNTFFRISSSEAPASQTLFLPFRIFNLFVRQLQSRYGTL